MKRVTYGGNSFLTTDEGANALLDFAASAAMNAAAEVVSMPTVGKDGRVLAVNLLIGPSSEIIALAVTSAMSEPDTREAVAKLRASIARLSASSSTVHAGAIPWENLDSAQHGADEGDI